MLLHNTDKVSTAIIMSQIRQKIKRLLTQMCIEENEHQGFIYAGRAAWH